jgi:hypothetical protein
MLADIGFLQQEEGNQWDFGAGGAQHFAKAAEVSSAQVSFGGSLDESSDRYKAMTMSAKMKWFDVHGDSLISEPDDLTFRRLFKSGKGRTPNWRVDFTKWCVLSLSPFSLFFFNLHSHKSIPFFFRCTQRGKSYSVGHGFSPPPTAAPKANESWTEMDDAKKMSFFESFKKELDEVEQPVGAEIAEKVLREMLKTWQINSQGAAKKKLREFSLRFDYHIDGLSASSSSSSSSGAFAGNKRARLAALLEESVMLSEQLGKKVSRAQLYTIFEM